MCYNFSNFYPPSQLKTSKFSWGLQLQCTALVASMTCIGIHFVLQKSLLLLVKKYDNRKLKVSCVLCFHHDNDDDRQLRCKQSRWWLRRRWTGGFQLGPLTHTIFLELPEPWLAVPHAVHGIRPNEKICSYSVENIASGSKRNYLALGHLRRWGVIRHFWP